MLPVAILLDDPDGHPGRAARPGQRLNLVVDVPEDDEQGGVGRVDAEAEQAVEAPLEDEREVALAEPVGLVFVAGGDGAGHGIQRLLLKVQPEPTMLSRSYVGARPTTVRRKSLAPGEEHREMLQETVEHLATRGFVREDQRIDRDRLADETAQLLSARLVEEEDEIDEKSLTTQELRYQIVGTSPTDEADRELDTIFSLLTTASGKVQERLGGTNGDGLVLCMKRITRKLSGGNGEVAVTRVARFATADPELIERHFWGTGQRRLVSAATSFQRRLELGAKRQPELAARRQPMIARTYEQLARELPQLGRGEA